MNEKLELKFDPRTIEHLGIKMYSRLPSALAELIANSYDAQASEVHIHLFDEDLENLSVEVSDNGIGMSFEEINHNFLVIGKKRRDDKENINIINRKITGRKGLGKLALFGIGKMIDIKTCVNNRNIQTQFSLVWNEIISTTSGQYTPNFKQISCESENQGTTIIVSNLKRTSPFNVESIVFSLSKLFNFFDKDFRVFVCKNDEPEVEVTKETRIESIDKQFEWNVKEVIKEKVPEFSRVNEIDGIIISSKKPLKTDFRGITLYARGRQANEASFFGLPEAGHAFSYITGWIECDYVDEQEEDLISTDRQQIDWENPLTIELQDALHKVLRYIVSDWSEKRKEEKITKINERTSVNIKNWIENVPQDLRPKLEKVISSISRQPEIDDNVFDNVVVDINKLVPEYTYFHYRMLHDEIKDISKEFYKREEYYNAFIEALKRYKNRVKEKSKCVSQEDWNIMAESFGVNKLLVTTEGFLKKNGNQFSSQTIENIENGQKHLSLGIVAGARNILSHEEIRDLITSGLFTEKDCLDFLSLLSHLFKRLDESKRRD